MNNPKKIDEIVWYSFFIVFFSLLIYAGYLSYKSIDYKVLDRLESQKLVLPTPIATPSNQISK